MSLFSKKRSNPLKVKILDDSPDAESMDKVMESILKLYFRGRHSGMNSPIQKCPLLYEIIKGSTVELF